MNVHKSRDKKKIEYKDRLIKRQTDEIQSLKEAIAKLEISCEKKDELINSVDTLRNDMMQVVADLKEKGNEYDELVAELRMMKKIMNEEVFKGRWSLVKLLIR